MISVIICTYNRSESLKDTLESIEALFIPEGLQWELIIVDNNSTDNTKKIVEHFADTSKVRTHYVFESHQGLSFARNAGIRHAQGEIIAFTDDDVIVEKNWLRFIAETFVKYNVDCVSGKILPIWLSERPDWLSDDLLKVLAILDHGDQVHNFTGSTSERLPFGANFSFKKNIFTKNGFFNEKLAPGEDQEMFQRLLTADGKAIYNANIVVHHKIPPERLTKAYFRSWHHKDGKVSAELEYHSRLKVFGIPGYIVKQALWTLSKYLYSKAIFNEHKAFINELKLRYFGSLFLYKIKRFS